MRSKYTKLLHYGELEYAYRAKRKKKSNLMQMDI